MSKFGSKFGSALSSTKQLAQRTTQKVLVKAGKAEETVDVELNAYHEQFEVDFTQIKALKKDMKKYLVLLKEIAVSLSVVAVDLAATLESSPSNLTIVGKTFQGRTGEMDQARDRMEHRVHSTLAEPLSTFLHQYKSLASRYKTHENRRTDKDRYYRQKLKLSEKDKHGELPHIEAQYTAAVENYSTLNRELHQDFPALHSDRYLFFEPFLSEFILGQAEYFRELAAIMDTLPPMISHINTATLAEHPPVITPDESSAAGQESVVPRKSKGDHSTPPPAAVGGAAPPPQETVSNQYAQGPSQGASVAGAGGGVRAAAPAPAPAPARKLPPKVPPTPSGPKAKGLYAFQAAGKEFYSLQDDTELGFNPGDVLTIHKQSGEWWEAELNGRRGLIPANYVQLV